MMSTFVERSSYVDTVTGEGARVSEVARIGPMDARVPHLRRWKLADVVAHLGGVHRWAAEIVSTGSMKVGHRRGRDTGNALIAWFDEGLEHLTATLRAADLDERCQNFSPGSPKNKGFWARRQAHETTMHRWDAESAIGQTTPIAPMFAADGIDELLDTFTRARGGHTLGAPIALDASDTGSGWVVYPTDREGRVGFERTATPARGTVASISGTAERVLLALWHRLALEDAELIVSGQRAVAEAFVAGPVSP